jgi:hypothetical protein
LRFIKVYNYKIYEGYVEVYFTNKKGTKFIAYLDIEDLQKLLDYPFKFHPAENNAGYYLKATKYLKLENSKPAYEVIIFHRYILGFGKGDEEEVDHINHNTLDNRKENLRIITNAKNCLYRKGKNKNNTSGYRNICKINDWWVVQLQVDKKNKRIGKFKDLCDAIDCARQMRKEFYGEFAGES